ncbi:MAG: B12-binding domain-containing radical SAM protein [Bacteroidetes bacterium]|nr:B12-binding domain-containing radical SAM protein [Bacteroidota bacterium]
MVLASFPLARHDGLNEVSCAPYVLSSYVTENWGNNNPPIILALDIPHPIEDNECADLILQENPNVVGFSTYVWNYKKVERVINLVKKYSRDTICIVGGPHAEVNCDEQLVKGNIDFFILGEGEQKLLDLLKIIFLKSNKKLKEIPGLLWYDDDGIHGNRNKSTSIPLSKIPSPWLNGEIELNKKMEYAVSVEISRGCPFKCTYCNWGGKVRTRIFDTKKVINELDVILQNRNVRSIFLNHFDLFAQQASAEIILDYLYENITSNVDIYACASLRKISKGLIEKSRRIPNFTVGIGIQSTDDDVLKLVKRRPIKETLSNKLLPIINEFPDAPLAYDIIGGLPGQTISSFRSTIDDILKIRPFSTNVYTLQIIPGSDIWENDHNGIISERHPPHRVVKTQHMSEDDLQQVKKIAAWLEFCIDDRFLRDVILEIGNNLQVERAHYHALEHIFQIISNKYNWAGSTGYPESISINEEELEKKNILYQSVNSPNVRKDLIIEAIKYATDNLPEDVSKKVNKVGTDYIKVIDLCNAISHPPPHNLIWSTDRVKIRTRGNWAYIQSTWTPYTQHYTFQAKQAELDLLLLKGDEIITGVPAKPVHAERDSYAFDNKPTKFETLIPVARYLQNSNLIEVLDE